MKTFLFEKQNYAPVFVTLLAVVETTGTFPNIFTVGSFISAIPIVASLIFASIADSRFTDNLPENECVSFDLASTEYGSATWRGGDFLAEIGRGA